MSDFLKDNIKKQFGSVRADWVGGGASPYHTSDMSFPPNPIGQRDDSGYAGTALEIKSCDDCLLNYDNYLCRHPNADGSFKTYEAPDGEVHEKCPLKTLGLTLNVKAEKP